MLHIGGGGQRGQARGGTGDGRVACDVKIAVANGDDVLLLAEELLVEREEALESLLLDDLRGELAFPGGDQTVDAGVGVDAVMVGAGGAGVMGPDGGIAQGPGLGGLDAGQAVAVVGRGDELVEGDVGAFVRLPDDEALLSP